MQSTAQNYNGVSSALIAVGPEGLSSLHVFSRVILGLSKNLVLCGPTSVTHGNRKQGWCKQKSLDTHSGLVCSGTLCFLSAPLMHLLLCKAKSVIITKTCFLLISYLHAGMCPLAASSSLYHHVTKVGCLSSGL